MFPKYLLNISLTDTRSITVFTKLGMCEHIVKSRSRSLGHRLTFELLNMPLLDHVHSNHCGEACNSAYSLVKKLGSSSLILSLLKFDN